MWGMGYAQKGRLGIQSLVDGYGLAAIDDSKEEDDGEDYGSEYDDEDADGAWPILVAR